MKLYDGKSTVKKNLNKDCLSLPFMKFLNSFLDNIFTKIVEIISGPHTGVPCTTVNTRCESKPFHGDGILITTTYSNDLKKFPIYFDRKLSCLLYIHIDFVNVVHNINSLNLIHSSGFLINYDYRLKQTKNKRKIVRVLGWQLAGEHTKISAGPTFL